MSEYDDDFTVDPNVSYGSTPTITYINEAGVPESVAEEVFKRGDIASVVERWSRQLNNEMNGSGGTGNGSMFYRTRYEMTDNIFDQMLQCTDAVETDDILSTVCDTVEGLAFNKMSFECYDEDQEDVWNQIAADIDLDSKLREMWRELYKVSQVYIGVYWDERTYTVRTPPAEFQQQNSGAGQLPPELIAQQNKMKALAGHTEGFQDPTANPNADQKDAEGEDPNAEPAPKKRKRRKKYSVWAPVEMTILDPTKVMPVGQLMFGRERFAYLATAEEHDAFTKVFQGSMSDDTVYRLLEGPYMPSAGEQALVGKDGANRLWLFRKHALFRHTLTRSSYERWAPLRLKSVLPLLDMKAHLRASDRAHLIGATNFIVVLKRGTDAHPAKKAEIEQLQGQARVVARMPILVGPHDLTVEIVTPKLDFTLSAERYQVLDERIVFRALQSFRPAGAVTARGDDTAVMSQVIARGIESRRHELKRTLEAKLFQVVLNVNEGSLTEKPKMTFHPRRVTLSYDAAVINGILKLRDRGDLSRETTLEEFDYDQDVEFLRRKREKEVYDSGFKSSVPHSSPALNPFGAPGAPPAAPLPQGSALPPNNGRPPGAPDNPAGAS